MTQNRRKKNSRARGSWTHGYGEKKKHRGAGSRGGRGMAGTGKRGDVKKPSINPSTYFGKFGMKTQGKLSKDLGLNISQLQSSLETFVSQKIATKSGDAYTVDLTKTQYVKLLGSGAVHMKMNVTVGLASASAVEKIGAFGGSVTTTQVKKEKKSKKTEE